MISIDAAVIDRDTWDPITVKDGPCLILYDDGRIGFLVNMPDEVSDRVAKAFDDWAVARVRRAVDHKWRRKG